jgi:hypothetical protein
MPNAAQGSEVLTVLPNAHGWIKFKNLCVEKKLYFSTSDQWQHIERQNVRNIEKKKKPFTTFRGKYVVIGRDKAWIHQCTGMVCH